MFPSFELFGREFGMYGVMVVIGGLLCGLVGTLLVRRYKLNVYDFVLIMLAVGAGAFLGSHIIYALTNLELLIKAFQNIGSLWFEKFWTIIVYCVGGMVFYGGFLGGLIAIPIYCHFDKRITVGELLDVYAVLVPLFHIFGRIGCFLGGCCYGIESSFGFTAHGNTINPGVNDVNRFPVQLVEAACNLLIFLLILTLFRKALMKDKLIYVYMLVYPVVRFSLEFLRGDEIRGFLFGISTSQWISILLFVYALLRLGIGHFRKKKDPVQLA